MMPALLVDAFDEQPNGEGELADEDRRRDDQHDPAAPLRSDDEDEGVDNVPGPGDLVERVDQARQVSRLANEIAGEKEETAGEQQADSKAVGVSASRHPR